jgi:hypothetical protein
MTTEAQLTKTIKVLIEKGDKAREKAEQFYIAAGQHLKTLKAEHKGNTAEWELLLKDKCGIGKSRAYELMKIADGRTSVEQVRADKAESVRKVRAAIPLRSGKQSAPLANVCPASVAPEVMAVIYQQEMQRLWDAAPTEARQAFVEANEVPITELLGHLRKRVVAAAADRAIERAAAPAIQQALTPVVGDPGEIPGFLRRVQ